MAANKEDQLQEAYRELHNNIQRKRYAIDTLESEYNKSCLKRENNVKHLEELHSKKYLLESYLKSSECRVTEYEKNEKEWEKDTCELKQTISEIKQIIQDEENLAQLDDENFNTTVKQLTTERAKDRDMYERNNLREEIDFFLEEQSSIEQEIVDIQSMIKEAENFNWKPSEDFQSILNNYVLMNKINSELKELEDLKNNLAQEINILREKETNLEQEIDKLNVEV